jgi:hypothetical protein
MGCQALRKNVVAKGGTGACRLPVGEPKLGLPAGCQPALRFEFMFDLEAAIAEWRQQMLAAGLRVPDLLDELEGHLREEVGRLTKSGIEDAEAFRLAAECVGQGKLLSAEFAKTRSIHDFLSKSRVLRINLSVNAVLGLIWLTGLSYIFLNERLGRFDAKDLLFWSVFAGLLAGGVLLTFGAKSGRFFIRTGALLFLANAFFQTCLFAYMKSWNLTHGSTWEGLAEHWGLIVFMVVTIVILHLPERMNLKATVKI